MCFKIKVCTVIYQSIALHFQNIRAKAQQNILLAMCNSMVGIQCLLQSPFLLEAWQKETHHMTVWKFYCALVRFIATITIY